MPLNLGLSEGDLLVGMLLVKLHPHLGLFILVSFVDQQSNIPQHVGFSNLLLFDSISIVVLAELALLLEAVQDLAVAPELGLDVL